MTTPDPAAQFADLIAQAMQRQPAQPPAPGAGEPVESGPRAPRPDISQGRGRGDARPAEATTKEFTRRVQDRIANPTGMWHDIDQHDPGINYFYK